MILGIENASISPIDGRQNECPDAGQLNCFMKDAWLKALEDFKTYQERLLEDLHDSLVSTYQKYLPGATEAEKVLFLSDMAFRSREITEMENTNVLPESSEYWPQYHARFRSFDLLKLDVSQIEKLCAMARSGKGADVAIVEHDIATNGDIILEFSNSVSHLYPVVQFRVLSYMLAEVSPYFAKILSYPKVSNPLEMPDDLPPPPYKQVWRDGTEVKVYRMPQLELDRHGSLTTLLHAAHMHADKIPRRVSFPEFVSIADVCYRYQCTSPLEMTVEYRWLPQWKQKARDDFYDFVLISYVFGLRGLFKQTSKLAILNITSEKGEHYARELWPPEVRRMIFAVREAKIAQIFAACSSAVQEFLCPPKGNVEVGNAFTLTSTPRCPKRLHECDATNLGWLILIFNELGILPTIMNDSNQSQAIVNVQHSISQLIGSLRRIPRASDIHSSFCDHVPAFRATMVDIYNSIDGLAFHEVSGRDGWALSRRYESQGIFELPVSMLEESKNPSSHIDEAIVLQIFLQIGELRDLQAIAMVDKSFYAIYKKNELVLMKNIIKVGRQSSGVNRNRQPSPSAFVPRSPIHISAVTRTVEFLPSVQDSDLVDETTPPDSPLSVLPGFQLTPVRSNGLLPRPNRDANGGEERIRNRLEGGDYPGDPKTNYKFLSGDLTHGKSLVIEGKKHLQKEQDRNLRNGHPCNAATSLI